MTAQPATRDVQVTDPVQLAVVRSALVGVAREMGTIMERASYSSILNEGKDFSCAVFNRDGELVAEGEFVLVHLAAMHEAVQVLISHFGPSWQPGDIAIHNDPYEGGSHLPDINLVRPVFSEDEVVAYVATRAHYPDVGGSVAGSFSGEAESLFEEGIVIPPLFLARQDALDEQLIALWARNVRVAKRLRADLMAQVASVRVGERSVLELIDRFGRQPLLDVLAEIPEYGEALMRGRIQALLEGENEFYDFMDDGGPDTLPVRIHLAVRVQGSEIEFDYRQSDRQAACPINAPPAVVKSATYGAMKCLLIPELPLNSGMFRPMKVLTEPGTVTHPLPPAPVAAGNTNTSQRILDICLAAVGEMMPGGAGGMAGSYSANSDIGIGGHDPRTGDEFVLYMMPVGGIGARRHLDGESALINYMGNCSSQPVEVWESMHPLRVNEYRLRPDSAGPGRRRGGFGLCVEYEALDDGLQVSVFTERQRFAPLGLHLGRPAFAGKYWVRRGDQSFPLPTKTSRLWLRKGDAIVVHTPGGGGYGDPHEREPDLVASDVRQGLVSIEQAAGEYGVVVAAGTIDDEATARLRGARQSPNAALRIEALDADAVSTIRLGQVEAAALGIADGQIVCCTSPRCSVYTRAVVDGTGKGTVLATSAARALQLAAGDEVGVQPLATRWEPYRTDDLRRYFSITRLTNEEGAD